MSLDLGSLVGEVRLDDTLFESTYIRVVRQMQDLGARAGAAAAGTTKLDRSLSQAGASANTAAAGLGRADKALAEAGVSASDAVIATNAVKVSITEAALASSRAAQALLRQAAAQARLTELEQSGKVSERQLAAARATLLAATDRAAIAQDRLGKSSGFTSQAWQSAGRGMVIAGGLISAGFVIAGKAAADFDAKMTLVRTLAKATPAEMSQLRAAALSVGQAYGYSAGQVADAEAELVKAGLSVKDIVGGALVGALTLAAAGQEDVAAATNTAAVAMTQFHLSGKDVPHIADLLAAGADKALGSVADLSEALTYGGLAAHQAGLSIEQTIGVLAELAQSGQLGSIAGTQFAQMLRNLEAPTTKAKAEMKALGIEVYGSNGQMLDMATIADELHDKIGKLPPAQRDAALAALFTARSVRAATILMRDGGDVVRDWTKKVDDSGFAALQASGKLDSLSGDLTKLKSALNAAFIGAGENAQGPLRSIVQDVTQVVEAWDNLPGPVKTGAEALAGVAGAVLLLGGGMLLLLPRIQKTREAMEELGISGSRVGGILGKAGLVGAILGAAVAVGQINDAMHHTSLNADAMSASLEHLARTGQVTGEITRAFGSDLSKLHSVISLSGGGFDILGLKFHSLSQTFSHGGSLSSSDFAKARSNIQAVDQALAGLVTSGHADEARSAYDQLTAAAKAQGVSVQTLASRFPAYAGAVRASAESAANAANGVDKYGNAVGKAAEKTKSATDAAKAYGDALHALADPLFAMNQALNDLRDKQSAASAAIKKYGANSREARQANLDVASSALDVAAAAKTLAGSVQDGTTSLAGAKGMLRTWVAAGIITKSEAKQLAASFGQIITKADQVSGAIDRSARAARSSAKKFGAAGNDAADSYAAGVAKAEVKAVNAAAHMHRVTYQAASKVDDFIQAGANAAAGYAEGINSGDIKAINAAVHMGKISAQAAAKAIESHSPSKVFATIGKSVPDGYVLGIKAGMPMVEEVGKDLAAALSAGYLKGQPQVLAGFAKGGSQALTAVGGALRSAQSKLSSDLQAQASASQSIASGLTGNFALSNAFGPYGNVLNLSSFFGGGAKMVATDEALLKRLRAKHLAAGLVTELGGLSPQQAVAIETNILSGKSGSIAAINRNYAALSRGANAIGAFITDPEYGQPIARDRASLTALQRIESLMTELLIEYKKNPKKLASALDQVVRGIQAHHR